MPPLSLGIGLGICHGGSLWTPDMLPSGMLQGYHRADDPAIVLSSGRMQSLPDKLAGKPALSEGTVGQRPLLDTTLWNGKSCLYFDGSRTMRTTSNVSLKGKFAFIAVASINSVAWLMEQGNTAVGTGQGSWIYSDPSLPLYITRVGAGGGQSIRKWTYASPYYGQPCIIVHYCDGTDAGHKFRVNGVEWPLTAFGAPYNTDPGANNVASNPIYYANRGDTGAGAATMQWGCDLYLQDQSLVDIQNVEQFLMRDFSMTKAGEGVCIGDSTSAAFGGYHALGYFIRPPAIDPLQCRVIMLAYPGEVPAQQKTHWDTASPKGVSSLKWINYLCGVNRIFQDASAATIRDEINTHLNSIRTTNPSVKIVINTLLPCYQRIVDVGVNVAARQAALEALNTMIRNGEITAADTVIDMYAAFGDVSDSRKLRIANTSDGIHEDDVIRAEMATLINTQLGVWGLY